MEEAEKTSHTILGLSPYTCSKCLVTPFLPSSASQALHLLQQPEQGWKTPEGAGISLARVPAQGRAAGEQADALGALRLVRCYQQRSRVGCEYTSLSKLTSSSALTPPDLGGESRKADCKSLLFHKITFARGESKTPAFEALFTLGRATSTVLHVPWLPAPSIPPSFCPSTASPVLAPQLGPKALPAPRKQQGESGKWAGMESPRNCLLTGTALVARQHQRNPQPQVCETACQGTEHDGGALLSPAKPAWLLVGIPQAELGIVSGSS